jgi:predicted nucleic acid-binding protein
VSSPNIESVAADSNVLLSAAAGRAARRVFDKSELIVATTERNIAEVFKYLPVFATRYHLPHVVLRALLSDLRIKIYAERLYADKLKVATELLAGRDPDDIPLAALALTLRIPIWSNDRDYEKFPHGVYSTARLLKILGV